MIENVRRVHKRIDERRLASSVVPGILSFRNVRLLRKSGDGRVLFVDSTSHRRETNSLTSDCRCQGIKTLLISNDTACQQAEKFFKLLGREHQGTMISLSLARFRDYLDDRINFERFVPFLKAETLLLLSLQNSANRARIEAE